MRLILARHGETHQIASGITMGQGVGGDLNNVGLHQARRLAEWLKAETFHHAYVSDLKRAVDTASEILKHHSHVPVQYRSELRERSLGIYEGKPKPQWKQAVQSSPLPFALYRPKGGESYTELQQRITRFFDELIEQHPHDSVLVVSHGGTLTMLYLALYNLPLEEEEYERHRPDNTAVTVLDIRPDRSVDVLTLNSTDHLQE